MSTIQTVTGIVCAACSIFNGVMAVKQENFGVGILFIGSAAAMIGVLIASNFV